MIKTSQWVSLGHPDKVADYISEKILDEYLKRDKSVRYALEVQIKDNFVTLAGEITSNAIINKADRQRFVKEAVKEIGYTKQYQKYWGRENTICDQDIIVEEHISQQSSDIAQGVNNQGWGDQGIMFGYASNNQKYNYMPKDYYLAKTIGQKLFKEQIGGLDIKTQVTLKNNKVEEIVIAIPLKENKDEEIKNIIKEVCGEGSYNIYINGTGKYVKHGPIGDSGTTGRKLVVDFYGGNCKIGGGSPWTKDGTKADLTLNLYAREKAIEYIKKHPDEVECWSAISCRIGSPEITISIFNSYDVEIDNYRQIVKPSTLIKKYKLNESIYCQLCRDGLFSKIR